MTAENFDSVLKALVAPAYGRALQTLANGLISP